MEKTLPKISLKWAQLHKDLGCHGCRFADYKMLGCGACCTRHEGFVVGEAGKCMMKEVIKW